MTMRQPLDENAATPPPGARFDESDLRRFARLSGDWNPAHVDPLLARREIFGSVVAHGISVLLRGLDSHAGGLLATRRLRSLRCVFEHPVYSGEQVSYRLLEQDGSNAVLEAWVASGPRALRAEVEARLSAGEDDAWVIPEENRHEARTPHAPAFESLAGKEGGLELWLDTSQAAAEYPALASCLSRSQLAALLAVSRLVGMECPGLRSVLSSFRLDFSSRSAPRQLLYRVVRVVQGVRRVEIRLEGPRVIGEVVAFVPPKPQAQPEMGVVAGEVQPDEFARETALIIGGSRGLGEVTAKIVSAGGGLSVITYASGAGDAERVALEIRARGARCEVAHCDVVNPAVALAELARRIPAPSQLYYFASPRILMFRGKSVFDAGGFGRFAAYYVEGLLATHAACRSLWDRPLSLFYPSSDAVLQRTAALLEYATAKAAGEFVCGFLEGRDPRLAVLVARLPRSATDQTLTLVPRPARNALEVMLPLVRELTRIGSRPS